MRLQNKYLLAFVLVIAYLSWHRDTSTQTDSKKKLVNTSRMPASTYKLSKAESPIQNPKEIELLLTKISEQKNLSEDCKTDDSCETQVSPGDEFYRRTKKLEGDIANLNLLVQSTRSTSIKLGEAGRELLDYEDGSVKEQALKLLLSQPEDIENIEPVVKGVLGYHDAKLVQLAVSELQRYLADQNAFKIHWGVRDCLLTGSLMVREELSVLLRPFINEGSLQFYRDLSLNPQIDKRVKENLISAIEEYQKQSTGG